MADGGCDIGEIHLENAPESEEHDNEMDNGASAIECKKEPLDDNEFANCSRDDLIAKLKLEESKCDDVPFNSLIQIKDNNKINCVSLSVPDLTVKKQFICCGKDLAPNLQVPSPVFTSWSFDVRVLTGPGRPDYRDTKRTHSEIIPSECYHEVQTGRVILYLAKKEATTWPGRYDDYESTT